MICQTVDKEDEAQYCILQVRPKSVYRVEPADGEIPSERSMEVTITACLNDCVR